jgi:hypothetical protein
MAEHAATTQMRETFLNLAKTWKALAVELEIGLSLLQSLNGLERNSSGGRGAEQI